MATDVERLVVRLEGRIRDFERSMQRANRSANKAATGIERRFARTNQKLQRDFRATGGILSRGFGGIGAAAGIGGGAFGLAVIARGAVSAADTITEAGNQIRAAFTARGITDNVDRVREKLIDLAVETRSEFGATTQLFSRLIRATESINAPVDQVIRATEILNKAFQASGATAQEAANGVRQLAQGLASGALQGDELRSIRENAPVIAKAIADSFGVGIGALKELGSEGKLTAETVFPAIIAGGAEIDRQFAKTDLTISKAFGNLVTRLDEAIGNLGKTSGAAGGLAGAVDGIAAAVDSLGQEWNREFSAMERQIDDLWKNPNLRNLNRFLFGESGKIFGVEVIVDRRGLSDLEVAAKEAEAEVDRLQKSIKDLQEDIARLSPGTLSYKAANDSLLRLLDMADEANAKFDRFKQISNDVLGILSRLSEAKIRPADDFDIVRLGRELEALIGPIDNIDLRIGAWAESFTRSLDAADAAKIEALFGPVDMLGEKVDDLGDNFVSAFDRVGDAIQSAWNILNGFFGTLSNPPSAPEINLPTVHRPTGSGGPATGAGTTLDSAPFSALESQHALQSLKLVLDKQLFVSKEELARLEAIAGTSVAQLAKLQDIGSGVQNLGPEFGRATSGISTAINAGASSTVSAIGSGASSTVGAINQAAVTIVSGVGASVERGIAAAQGGAFALGSGPLGTRPSEFTFNGNLSPDIGAGNINIDPVLARSVVDNMLRYGLTRFEANRRLGLADSGGGASLRSSADAALAPTFAPPSAPIVQGPSGFTFEQLTANEAAMRRFADSVSPDGRSSLEGPREVQVDRSVNPQVNVVVDGVMRREVEIIAESVFERASREFAVRAYLS